MRADLPRPVADIGIARGVVSLHRAVFRGAGFLSVSRRAAARVAMERAGLKLRRRGAGDRGSPAQCRCQRAAGRSDDRRRRRIVGGHHFAGEGDAAAAGAAGKGARLPGGAVDPDSGVRGVDFGRNHDQGSRSAGAVADGLSGVLGGRIDVSAVVHTGQNLFRQQAVGVYLHHTIVWRGGELLHHARHPDLGVRRRGPAGDSGALSREPARGFRAEARARSQRSGVTALVPRVTASPLSVYTFDRSVFACSKAVAASGLYWSLIANSDIALSTNSGFSWFIVLSVAATFSG